ncbi:hypothetical protein A9Q81_26820 [Gammaproteobacteria bacterium 42_54_T18]|nr:hypothetical protein A9Q81_26820 [Gammaproteobacteria bacterium 42_54_T18]
MKKTTKAIKHLSAASVFLLVITSQAWALNLQEAKSNGFVKETATGYLIVVDTTQKEAVSLVEDINVKRKNRYTEIANRNNVPVRSVEKQAAKKLMK